MVHPAFLPNGRIPVSLGVKEMRAERSEESREAVVLLSMERIFKVDFREWEIDHKFLDNVQAYGILQGRA